jgi:hypothetical protein
MRIDEEDNVDQDSQEEDNSNDESEHEDLCGEENFKIVNGVKIFFNHFPEPTVRGLLSLNNILKKQIFQESQLNEALYIWSTLDDIKILLIF